MSDEFNLRSRVYWKRVGWGLFLGLLSAIGAFVFIIIMNLGQSLVFTNLAENWTLFSGPWWMIGVMTIAGFLVGLIHHFTPARQMNAFDAIDEGYLDPKPVPSSLLASLVSLIGGFSLGTEVPTGMLAAGLSSWFSKRQNMDSETTRTNVLSSVSGAYAGLFSSPFAMVLMLLNQSTFKM